MTVRSLHGLRVAVTGAGGFLGPVVAGVLAESGARVTALLGPGDDRSRTPRGAAEVVRADICDADALRTLVAGAEAVVHLAGPASVAGSFQDPALYLRVHGGGTAAVLEACRGAGVQKLVYVSSAEVYGRPLRSPVAEDHPLSARSPYGAAKIAAEKLIEAYAHAYALRAVILRPFSIYGPGASPQSLIPRIIDLARRGGPVTLRDLKPVRDYCFVTDVARAVAAACAFDEEGVSVFNLGTMQGTSVARVAGLILGVAGASCAIEESAGRDRPGASEIYQLVADNRRAVEVLGWRPRVSLEEGLRATFAAIVR